MRKLTFTVLLCVLSIVCLPQSERQYAFVHYGTDKGLAAYEVNGIVQDETGYIWVGTATGLQRFDGARFITFYHHDKDSLSIPENHILQLLVDKNNNLWLMTASGRFGIFDTKKFRFKEVLLKPTYTSSATNLKYLATDSHANVFVVCLKGELLIYNPKSNCFVSASKAIPFPDKWTALTIVEDSASDKYYLGSDSGLVVFNGRTQMLSYRGHNAAHEPLINEYGHIQFVGPQLLDSKHRLWFMSWKPNDPCPFYYSYDLSTNSTTINNYSFYPLIKGYHEPVQMLQQKNGAIWIRGANIFARYLEKQKIFQLVHNGYVNEQSISFEEIRGLTEDREQNLWVATNNNGLYRFNPSKEYFLNIPHLNRGTNLPADGSPISFIPDNNGTVLMGSWGDGIYRYDSCFNNIPVNINGIAEKNYILVWSMLQSADGHTVWMGTQPGGMFKYDRISKKATHYNIPAIEQSTVRQIIEDKNGNLWLGTHGRGVFKCTKTVTGFDFNKNVEKIADIDARRIHSMCMDNSGLLWIGTNSNGAYAIDPVTNKVVHHFTSNSAPSNRITDNFVTSIFVYNDTTVIIAAGALNIFNTRTKTLKLPKWPVTLSTEIVSMQKDRNGFLWIALSAGICRYAIDKNIFIHFDRIDGIGNDHFQIAASATLPDGRMVFGNSNQFIVFDPQKIVMEDPAPDVTITRLKAGNQYLPVDSLKKLKFIELSYQNSLSIEFSGLLYSADYRINYKMDGIDKDWIHADNSRQVTYSYLPPGTYTFMAKSENSEGLQGKNITMVVLKIKPPFWQTWWFLGVIIFAALGIFLWVDKLRMQRIKATEGVRNRIAQSLTEDMSNSLSSINITSELAKTKVDTDNERTKEYINQISDSSSRMVQAMYDMVWSINPENDTLQHTIDRMKNYAIEIESQYSPSVIFQVDEQAKEVQLSMESRYEMLSIYKEALNNAAQHANAKYIEVNILYKKPVITLCIRDDGKGFDLETVELSRGLTEIRRRANTINATLTVKSEINTGTTVKLKINK